MKNKILAVSLISILSMPINSIAGNIVSDKLNSEYDSQRRPGLGQDSSRKEGHSSQRKSVSGDNTPRSSGRDHSKRTYGGNFSADERQDIRRGERSERVKNNREKWKKEDIKNNPLSPYKR